MQQVSHIFHLVEQKYNYSLQKDAPRATHVPYMSSLQHALTSIDEEIRANNCVKLEADLWWILRDFCNMIYTLEKEWYIDSVHTILERTLDTYEERVNGIKEGEDREARAWIQKERLFQEQAVRNSYRKLT